MTPILFTFLLFNFSLSIYVTIIAVRLIFLHPSKPGLFLGGYSSYASGCEKIPFTFSLCLKYNREACTFLVQKAFLLLKRIVFNPMLKTNHDLKLTPGIKEKIKKTITRKMKLS
jgi:hypothetical protein